MRCFIAIPIAAPVAGLLAPLAEAAPVGHPSPAEDLHLTLAFLGEQPDATLQAVHEGLQTLSAPGFVLRLQGLGTFGRPHPHTLWAGVVPSAALARLQAKVLSTLHGSGLELQRRRFRPHVTLLRLPRLDRDEEHKLARFLEHRQGYLVPVQQVDGFALYRSTLGRGAPVYEILAEYPLRTPQVMEAPSTPRYGTGAD